MSSEIQPKDKNEIQLKEVTVFQNSASFKLVGQYHCSRGVNEILMDHLTNKLDKDSIRVRGIGPGKIVNIIIEKIYSDELIKEKIKSATNNRDKLWCHAKDVDALHHLLDIGMECFWHEHDFCSLTRNGYIWTSEHNKFREDVDSLKSSRIVLVTNNLKDINLPISGICTDYPITFQEKYDEMLKEDNNE